MGNTLYRAAIVLGLAALTACATTTFNSTWKAPDAQPLGSLKGQKVVAVVVAKNLSTRRSAEDALAAVLNTNGAQGIASYTIVGEDITQDEAKAKAAIEKTGAVAVVVMRPVSKEKEISSTGRPEASKKAEPLGSAPDRVPAVEMTPHENLEAGAGPSAGLRAELQRHPVEHDGVVLADDAGLLVTQDLVEIDHAERHPRRGRVARGRACCWACAPPKERSPTAGAC